MFHSLVQLDSTARELGVGVVRERNTLQAQLGVDPKRNRPVGSELDFYFLEPSLDENIPCTLRNPFISFPQKIMASPAAVPSNPDRGMIWSGPT